MEAILPYHTKDKESFCKCVCELGFQDFVARKFIYIMQDSDLDVYQLMAEERLSLLIYGWEMCNVYMETHGIQSDDLPDNIKMVMKRLTYYSLDVWYSKEWEKCMPARKVGLFFCLNRAKNLMGKINHFAMLNWDYMLQFEMKPWRLQYLSRVFGTDMNEQRDENNYASIECIESMVINEDDVAYVKEEGYLLILFRLIKLIDAGSIEAVKFMSIRMVATFNCIYGEEKPSLNTVEKQCVILICHIYLMTLYELDDVRGFYIDNMMNNIRFYCAGMQKIASCNQNADKDMKLTAAQQIATACTYLNISSNQFFESFVFDKFDESFTTVFGVVSHSYLSYVLGNMLNEMNNMNEENFSRNLNKFKRILNYYVEARESSEQFTLAELQKINRRRRSNSMSLTMISMYEFKSKFCKGNRMSNIGNYENADEEEHDTDDTNEMNLNNLEQGRQIDPVFQNIPNNANILNYVYDILAKRNYKGWHFAKLVLLLKIIGHELNEIETWRYHPGLTTEFMLSLETKLARHYEDFAKIFEEHQFIEQEFWLTAFYLHPNPKYYGFVNRCGMRCNRRRNVPDANEETVKAEKIEKTNVAAKYGLLSSTFDVQEIINQTNLDAPLSDYDTLQEMLRSLHLPQNVVKDLLTVCFQRNKGFAWAVNWLELRKRCKTLYKIQARKRRLVELNMAEANDRLKFLKIDYNKYRNRPQLDYGAIEEGYEGTKYAECGVDCIEEYEDDEDDDDEYANEMIEYDRKTKEKEEKIKEEILEECFIGTRRTRARTAAVIQRCIEESKKAEEQEQEKLIDEEKPKEQLNPENEANVKSEVVKQDLNTWLKEHATFTNLTEGFKVFPNIWDFDVKSAENIADNSNLYFESRTKHMYDLFSNLKNIEKPIEPIKTTQEVEYESNVNVPRASSICSQIDNQIHTPIEAINETIKNEEPIPTANIYESNILPSNIIEQNSYLNESLDDNLCTIEENMLHYSSEDDMTYKLIQECITNEVKVLIPRLTIADITQLRQPKVFVERLDWNRSTLNKRRDSRKAYTDFELSSKSSDTLSSGQSSQSRKRKLPRKLTPKSKRRMYLIQKQYSSDSSNESDEYKSKHHMHKLPRSNMSRQRTASHQNMALASSTTSGVFHRLSSLSDNSTETPKLFDFIQISSSSSDDLASPIFINTANISEQAKVGDPLYEEEIII